MKHIECAGEILQGLNDLFKTLFSGLDKLIKVDVDVKKSEEQQDGTLLMQIDIKNADKDILLVKAVPKDEQAEDERWETVPDSLKSMRGNETTDMIFAVVGAILAVGGSLTQAATILAAFSPEARDQIASVLQQFGFRLQ